MTNVPYFEEDLAIISALGDNPNTDNDMSSADLKAAFDRAPILLQEFINNYVIPALNNYVLGNGYLPTEGGTMSGPITMGNNRITGLGSPVDAGDAISKAFLEALLPLTVEGGGTGGKTAAEARNNLDAAQKSHTHAPDDLTKAVPMDKGGTGAASGAEGLKNLLTAGYMQLSGYQIVEELPDPATVPEGTFVVIPIQQVT